MNMFPQMATSIRMLSLKKSKKQFCSFLLVGSPLKEYKRAFIIISQSQLQIKNKTM